MVRRVVRLVRAARRAVPGYGSGAPITRREVDTLLAYVGLRVDRAVPDVEMSAPAVLLPRINGHHRLIVSSSVGSAGFQFLLLHEIGHVLDGDADEPTFFRFSGELPESEHVADLFALVGLIDELDRRRSLGDLVDLVRSRVPSKETGFEESRILPLARRLRRVGPLPGPL